MEKLFFSLSLIIGALISGYALPLLSLRGTINMPLPINDLRKIFQKIGLLFFMPFSFMAAVWGVIFSDLRIVLLPLVGVSALILGGLLGYLLSKVLRTPPHQTGVLFCCGFFANIGAIGALTCFLFLGEAGFALVAQYKMFEEILYYTIGFPIARYYSGKSKEGDKSLPAKIGSILAAPFVATILSAFLLGLALNLIGIPRPTVFETLNNFCIPADTFILIFSIGLGMRLSKISNHLVPGVSIAVIKALLIPAVITCIAWLLGLGNIGDGLPLEVVFILSSMPVAFNSLVAASIYNLDLANSCWLLSTLSLVAVLPWLYWVLG